MWLNASALFPDSNYDGWLRVAKSGILVMFLYFLLALASAAFVTSPSGFIMIISMRQKKKNQSKSKMLKSLKVVPLLPQYS